MCRGTCRGTFSVVMTRALALLCAALCFSLLYGSPTTQPGACKTTKKPQSQRKLNAGQANEQGVSMEQRAQRSRSSHNTVSTSKVALTMDLQQTYNTRGAAALSSDNEIIAATASDDRTVATSIEDPVELNKNRLTLSTENKKNAKNSIDLLSTTGYTAITTEVLSQLLPTDDEAERQIIEDYNELLNLRIDVAESNDGLSIKSVIEAIANEAHPGRAILELSNVNSSKTYDAAVRCHIDSLLLFNENTNSYLIACNKIALLKSLTTRHNRVENTRDMVLAAAEARELKAKVSEAQEHVAETLKAVSRALVANQDIFLPSFAQSLDKSMEFFDKFPQLKGQTLRFRFLARLLHHFFSSFRSMSEQAKSSMKTFDNCNINYKDMTNAFQTVCKSYLVFDASKAQRFESQLNEWQNNINFKLSEVDRASKRLQTATSDYLEKLFYYNCVAAKLQTVICVMRLAVMPVTKNVFDLQSVQQDSLVAPQPEDACDVDAAEQATDETDSHSLNFGLPIGNAVAGATLDIEETQHNVNAGTHTLVEKEQIQSILDEVTPMLQTDSTHTVLDANAATVLALKQEEFENIKLLWNKMLATNWTKDDRASLVDVLSNGLKDMEVVIDSMKTDIALRQAALNAEVLFLDDKKDKFVAAANAEYAALATAVSKISTDFFIVLTAATKGTLKPLQKQPATDQSTIATQSRNKKKHKATTSLPTTTTTVTLIDQSMNHAYTNSQVSALRADASTLMDSIDTTDASLVAASQVGVDAKRTIWAENTELAGREAALRKLVLTGNMVKNLLGALTTLTPGASLQTIALCICSTNAALAASNSSMYGKHSEVINAVFLQHNAYSHSLALWTEQKTKCIKAIATFLELVKNSESIENAASQILNIKILFSLLENNLGQIYSDIALAFKAMIVPQKEFEVSSCVSSFLNSMTTPESLVNALAEFPIKRPVPEACSRSI